jgi:Zn-dependent M28 family amino/carboxypeptidase
MEDNSMQKRMFWLILLVFPLFYMACGQGREEAKPITPKEIEGHIRFLSDDLLGGRGVGSRGLDIAALYQENCFRGYGLEPFFEDSYRQPFELIGCQPDPDARLDVLSNGDELFFSPRKDFVVESHRRDAPEGVEAELIYAGYLIQAPERSWDDIKGMDLKGKALLVEVNEPGNYPGGDFDGEDMTYYGRWVYKFEKAAELGAAGVLIIHNTKGAAYGWDVVRNSWSQESFFLSDKEDKLFFRGWIHEDAAETLLTSAGLSLEQMKASAEKRDFKPHNLGMTLRVRQKPSFRSVSAENVAGVLRGTHKDSQDRYVILSAHFDHLGRNPDLEGDQIYNGAVDNCSASAAMLSLARYYAAHPDKLKLNLIFAAVNAEEQVLLGSDYFARHLSIPNSKLWANLNFEMTNVWGETEDVYTIGGSHSDLDDICREAAAAMDLKYIPERDKELGYFFRSDQLSFARAGIPAVWLHEGITSKGEDKDYIQKMHKQYRASHYHQVTDEFKEDWDLRGTVQITGWAQEIIRILEEMDSPPRFKAASSFRRPDGQ